MTTALVIEDDENNMVLITDLLHHAGYEVLQAYTGHDGVRMARECSPDFVLLDIQLPDIDGHDVLRLIRASEADGLPVIAVTSYAMSGDRDALLAAGCNGYIEKPINTRAVIAQIRAVTGEAE